MLWPDPGSYRTSSTPIDFSGLLVSRRFRLLPCRTLQTTGVEFGWGRDVGGVVCRTALEMTVLAFPSRRCSSFVLFNSFPFLALFISRLTPFTLPKPLHLLLPFCPYPHGSALFSRAEQEAEHLGEEGWSGENRVSPVMLCIKQRGRWESSD